MKDGLNGTTNIELVIKFAVSTGRFDIDIEPNKLREHVRVSIFVLSKIREEAISYCVLSTATAQENNIDYLAHHEWIFQILQVAEEDKKVARKVRMQALQERYRVCSETIK